MKAIMTDGGYWTTTGHIWLVSDGEPTEIDDRCTSDKSRTKVRRDWERRKASMADLARRAMACNMTVNQYLSDAPGCWE